MVYVHLVQIVFGGVSHHQCSDEFGEGTLVMRDPPPYTDSSRGGFRERWNDCTCSNGYPGNIYPDVLTNCIYGIRRFEGWCEQSMQLEADDPRFSQASDTPEAFQGRYYASVKFGTPCWLNSEEAVFNAGDIDAASDYFCFGDTIEDSSDESSDESSNESSDELDGLFLTSCFWNELFNESFNGLEGVSESTDGLIYCGVLTESHCDNGLPPSNSDCLASVNLNHLGTEQDQQIYYYDELFGDATVCWYDSFSRNPYLIGPNRDRGRFRVQYLCANTNNGDSFEDYGYVHYYCKHDGSVNYVAISDDECGDVDEECQVSIQMYWQFDTAAECHRFNHSSDESSDDVLYSLGNQSNCLAFLRSFVHLNGNNYNGKVIANDEIIDGIQGPGVTYLLEYSGNVDDSTLLEVDYLCPV